MQLSTRWQPPTEPFESAPEFKRFYEWAKRNDGGFYGNPNDPRQATIRSIGSTPIYSETRVELTQTVGASLLDIAIHANISHLGRISDFEEAYIPRESTDIRISGKELIRHPNGDLQHKNLNRSVGGIANTTRLRTVNNAGGAIGMASDALHGFQKGMEEHKTTVILFSKNSGIPFIASREKGFFLVVGFENSPDQQLQEIREKFKRRDLLEYFDEIYLEEQSRKPDPVKKISL